MTTKIEWTEETWNPVTGCSKVSAGCTNCYAERLSHRFGWTDKPWNNAYAAENVKLHPERLTQPLRWQSPRRIFVNSMSDLFHELVPDEFILRVFDVMASVTPACGKRHEHEAECYTGPRHQFQILTKRPERMLDVINRLPNLAGERLRGDSALCLALEIGEWPLPNVWLGVSVENQEAADERIPFLLQTPAAVRFLSFVPLLGPVDISFRVLEVDHPNNEGYGIEACEGIDWVIAGGESGTNARPMHPDWVRNLRDQCVDAGVSFFFKQWGEWLPNAMNYDSNPGDFDYERKHVMVGDIPMCRAGKKKAGRKIDGRTWDEYPVTP